MDNPVTAELTDHDNRAHARLSSSKAGIWTACEGAPILWNRQEAPFVDSPHAQAGREAALAAEITGKTGKPLPDAFAAAQLYLDTIQAAADACLDPVVEYESRRLYPMLKALNPLRGGTPDAHVYDRQGTGEAFVVDLKWGEGTYVPAKGNRQLIDYWTGLDLLMASERVSLLPQQMVNLIIVQPRWRDEPDRVRTWRLTASEARKEARKQTETAARITTALHEGKDLPRRPGSHCHYCPAVGCAERTAYKLAVLDSLDAPGNSVAKLPPAPATIAPAVISRILEHADALRHWLDSVESYALGEALAGRLPGWKAVAGKIGNRGWAKGLADGEVANAIKQLGIANPYDAPKLLSPAKVEEALGKGKAGKERMQLLAAYISRAPGGPTLVPETDPRPAFDRSASLSTLPALPAPGES